LQINRKVATSFGKEVKAVIKHLELNPFYQKINEKYRTIPVNKFPYLLFFELNEQNKEVKVIAIFNTHQNTEKHPA
jgi:hypothetical protein